jgi:hypothetical protein
MTTSISKTVSVQRLSQDMSRMDPAQSTVTVISNPLNLRQKLELLTDIFRALHLRHAPRLRTAFTLARASGEKQALARAGRSRPSSLKTLISKGLASRSLRVLSPLTAT